MLLTHVQACSRTVPLPSQPGAPWPGLPPGGQLCPRAGPRAPRRERCRRLGSSLSAHRAPRDALPAGRTAAAPPGRAGPAPRLRRGTRGTCSPAPGAVPASLPARPPSPAASPGPALLGVAGPGGARLNGSAAREPPGAAPHQPARPGPALPLHRPPVAPRGPAAPARARPSRRATSGAEEEPQQGPAPRGPGPAARAPVRAGPAPVRAAPAGSVRGSGHGLWALGRKRNNWDLYRGGLLHLLLLQTLTRTLQMYCGHL